MVAAESTLPLQLPSTQQLMAASSTSQLFPAGQPVSGNMVLPRAAVPANATLQGLPSETAYSLLLAARDTAQPQANYVPALTQLCLVAPDVKPPVFTGDGCQLLIDGWWQLELWVLPVHILLL